MKTIFYSLIIFLLLHSQTFSQSGWYEQTLPVSGTISDMQFIDSQTGWITLYSPFNLIKTTNSGKNWTILFSESKQFGYIDFVNDTIGYAIGMDNMFNGMVSKTTNGGLNWIAVYTGVRGYTALDFINQDTGWFGAFIGDYVQIIRTTNGGLTFEVQYSYMSAGQGIHEVFFVDKLYDGYYSGWFLNNGSMSKTTNSGLNWSEPVSSINGESGDYYSLFFLNKDTGWVIFKPMLAGTNLYKTINSGVNWYGQFSSSSIGGEIYFSNNNDGWTAGFAFKIFATSNSGLNWGYQITNAFLSLNLTFADSLSGWTGDNRLSHTTDGGGIITYVGIDPGITEIPAIFKLEQNYPNPFNPQTTIRFSVIKQSDVSLVLYDVTGKELLKVYDNELLAQGNYKLMLDFSRRALSSGTYFYTLTVNDRQSGNVFRETKKMIYLK